MLNDLEEINHTLSYIQQQLSVEELKFGAAKLIISTLTGNLDDFNIAMTCCNINYVNKGSGFSALHLASKFGLMDKVKLLVNHPTFEAKEDFISIYLAIKNGHYNLFKWLEESPSYVNKSKPGNRLNLAALSGSIQMAQHMLHLGDDPNARGWQQETSLMAALRGKDAVKVKCMEALLIKHGALLNGNPDLRIDSEMMMAIKFDRPGDLNILLKNGSNPNEVNHTGFSALEISAEFRNLACCKLLIEAGANMNTPAGNTPLINIAARRGQTQMCKLFIKHGADVNKVNLQKSALLEAIIAEHYETAIFLVENGADLNNCKLEVDVSLNFASRYNLKLTKVLIKHGADINRIGLSDTPLTSAIKNINPAIAKYLINAGADVNACDRKLKTPLMIAVELNLTKIVAQLVERNANLLAKDKNGNNIFNLMDKNRQPKIASIIENKFLTNAANECLTENEESSPKQALKRIRL